MAFISPVDDPERSDSHYGAKGDLDQSPAEPEGQHPSATTPPLAESLKITSPKHSAAGIPAVLSTLSHAYEEMGVVRGVRALLQVNKVDGFDCQSCAWPNPDGKRHIAEFCENGAKAVADEATTKRVTRQFFESHTLADLASHSDHWLGKQGRLTEPMVLREGASHYTPIEWDEAFTLIASHLNSLASPDQAVFYTSGRTSNEAAFLYQLFVRSFGTNNLPDCSNMCHESSGTALTETIGVGKGTVTLTDFELADSIFVIGQNPGTNHPRMLTALQAAKRNGCRIVSINPLPEAGLERFRNPQEVLNTLGSGTQLADLFLQVRINGDVAALKGIMKVMLEAEERRPGSVFDQDFIELNTVGYQAFRDDLYETPWDQVLEESGLSRERIAEAAHIAMHSERMICCWAMGLTQHKNAVATIQEIVNFLLLRGNIGRPGAGACPVRGHSNVQGDRTMGIWERPRDAFLDSLQGEFGFAPPRQHGFDTVETIKAMHDGRARVFFGLGGNFLSATPDTNFTAEALSKCELTVQVSTKLNRAHLITGHKALILPCLGRSEKDEQSHGEQFVTVEDSMGVISPSRGSFKPASRHLRSEPAIVAGLATATLQTRSAIDWMELAADYDHIRDHIAHVIPGFDDFNARIRTGPFYLPNAAREGLFRTTEEKAVFTVHPIPKTQLADDQLVMMTIRSHDQFNTTIYGLDDRYRGIHGGRRVIFMNRNDIAARGLREGQSVDLTSHFEGQVRIAERFTVVSFDIPRRCAATYFPETNVLVPIGSVAEKSNTPTSKYVVISVAPS
ncbi:MAG TPA: FdhF/YdeP family oxidoreductase [Thermoanaerobaculia bacterium]|nr:FdhF/YdeP family oxidoreductase [Thermoanaerobaculia bacterium]